MFWGRVETGKNIYIWAGSMWFWFIPKTASTASSSSGALVAAGSLQPKQASYGSNWLSQHEFVEKELSYLCYNLSCLMI
jgi:hypothetical protein